MVKKEKITTIKLEKETKTRLDALKEHHRETYNDIIKKTLNIINITIRNPITGARIFRAIKRKESRKKRNTVYQSSQSAIKAEE